MISCRKNINNKDKKNKKNTQENSFSSKYTVTQCFLLVKTHKSKPLNFSIAHFFFLPRGAYVCIKMSTKTLRPKLI